MYYIYCFVFYEENNPINLLVHLVFNLKNLWIIRKGVLFSFTWDNNK